MINVDQLNEDINKFGVVIERLEEVSGIYQNIQETLELEKSYVEKVTEIGQTLEKQSKSVDENLRTIEKTVDDSFKDVISQQDKQTTAVNMKLQELEKTTEAKLEKTEIQLRDRIALSESQLTLAINDFKAAMAQNLQMLISKEEKRMKTQLIVSISGIVIIIAVQLILFFS